MKTLVLDVGGTNVKVYVEGEDQPRKFPSGPALTPAQMVEGAKGATAGADYDRVSIGFPAPVADDRILAEPVNLGPGWVGYDLAAAFAKPVKLINAAAMQALGSYEGGRMLFLGLGTGLGTAMVINGLPVALELGHLPYRKGRSFEDYVGQRGLDRLGKRKWRLFVEDVTARLRAAMVADYVVLGGGNVRKLKTLPPHCRRGDNVNAFVGGMRLWDPAYTHGAA